MMSGQYPNNEGFSSGLGGAGTTGPPTGPPTFGSDAPGGAGPPNLPPPSAPSGDGAGWGSSKQVVRNPVPRVIMAAVLAVVFVGVGFAGFKIMSGESGSATPAEAVEALVDSMRSGDPLGMFEAIDPAEREAWVEPAVSLGQEMARLGLADEDMTSDDRLTFGDGMHIELVEPIEYSVEEVASGDTNISRVVLVGGKIRLQIDQEAMEEIFRDSDIWDRAQPVESEDVTIEFSETGVNVSGTTESNESEPMFLVAVDHGDGYYVSLMYTVAELIRLEGGQGPPDLDERLVPIGADSPEEAVRNALEAVADLNIEKMIGSLDPVEFAVLFDYWSLYGDSARSDLAEAMQEAQDNGVSWQIETVDMATEKVNGRTVVVITSFAASFDVASPDGFVEGRMEYDAEHLRLEVEVEEFGDAGRLLFELNTAEKSLLLELEFAGESASLEGTMDADGISVQGGGMFASDVNLEFEFDTMTGRVDIDSADFPLSAEGRFSNGCFELTIDGRPERPNCDPEVAEFVRALEELERALGSGEVWEAPLPRVVVVERDINGESGWFVSGVPTILDGITHQLSTMDPEDFD